MQIEVYVPSLENCYLYYVEIMSPQIIHTLSSYVTGGLRLCPRLGLDMEVGAGMGQTDVQLWQ